MTWVLAFDPDTCEEYDLTKYLCSKTRFLDLSTTDVLDQKSLSQEDI